MTLRDMADRHAQFIAGHLRDLDDALAFGYGQPATLVYVNPSYSATGVVTEAPASQAVNVDGPREESDQYQGAEFVTDNSKTVLFDVAAEGLDAEPQKGDRIVLADATTYVVVTVDRLQIRGGAHAFRLRCGQVVV